MTQIADAGRDKRGVFSFKVALALVFVGVFSFSAFIALSAFAPELARGDDGRGHSLSRSAIGYAAAVRLAQAHGMLVSVRRVRDAESSPGLVVFTPEYPPEANELLNRTYLDMLVVLPKWGAYPDPRHEGWVQIAGLRTEESVSAVMADFAPDARIVRAQSRRRPRLAFSHGEVGSSAGADLRAGPVDSLQTLSSKQIEPIVTDERGQMVLGRAYYENVSIYILADPDFLNTQGMANRDTARAGMAMLSLLHREGQPIAFDVTLNGFERSRSLIRLALEPPLLGASLCLMAAAALMGWRAATQSGPKLHEQRAIALGKRALADNSAALLRMVRREHRMGWGYAQLIAQDIAERLHLPRGDHTEMLVALDKLAQRLGLQRPFSDLVADANAAQDPVSMLAAARELHKFKEEVLRATR